MQLDYIANGVNSSRCFACDHFGCTNTDIAKCNQARPLFWKVVERIVRGKLVKQIFCPQCYKALLKIRAYREEWQAWEAGCRATRLRRT